MGHSCLRVSDEVGRYERAKKPEWRSVAGDEGDDHAIKMLAPMNSAIHFTHGAAPPHGHRVGDRVALKVLLLVVLVERADLREVLATPALA